MELNMDLERDFDYFRSLWEYRRPHGSRHSADIWDNRADEWAINLSREGAFRRDMDERVACVADYLRGRGLLEPGSAVVDIGCGPGRFVAEFAKTAGHATGLDLSPRMLELAADHARAIGVDNVSYLAGDFKEMDVDALGLTGAFDLVFTSITPAIGTMEGLRKLMLMSRGYCFNACCIHWEDALEERVGREVFGVEKRRAPLWDRRWFYALFNLLWLDGFRPETFYQKQRREDPVPVDEELSRFYTRQFVPPEEQKAAAPKVLEWLKAQADPDGRILQETEHWYGWLLWNVMEREDISREKRV